VLGEKVFARTDRSGMKEFFLGWVAPVETGDAALDVGRAWLRLTEVFSQDGFFTVSDQDVHVLGADITVVILGEVDVTDGGAGGIQPALNFDAKGQLTDVMENRDVQTGIRPVAP
jgi:hypothetical protein